MPKCRQYSTKIRLAPLVQSCSLVDRFSLFGSSTRQSHIFVIYVKCVEQSSSTMSKQRIMCTLCSRYHTHAAWVPGEPGSERCPGLYNRPCKWSHTPCVTARVYNPIPDGYPEWVCIWCAEEEALKQKRRGFRPSKKDKNKQKVSRQSFSSGEAFHDAVERDTSRFYSSANQQRHVLSDVHERSSTEPEWKSDPNTDGSKTIQYQ